MMVFLLTLAFLRETAGATFFHQYEKNGNPTLNCSPSATNLGTNMKYLWYKGQGSSLQTFEAVVRGRNKTTPKCDVDPASRHTEEIFPLAEGGIFACAPCTENNTCPLFNSNCSGFNFFIVATRNRAEEKKAFGKTPERYEPVLSVAGKDTLNLTCELNIKGKPSEIVLYWFKETTSSTCLFSASTQGGHGLNFFPDVNCCVDPAIKQRRTNHSVNFCPKKLHHNLVIANASSSDSGTYLCVVAIWGEARKRVWKIARNVSVEVTNPGPLEWTTETTTEFGSPKHSKDELLPISLGAIGGLVLIGGITGLLYWKKKAKGNPVEERPRNQTEMDDCSPYAVSSWKDTCRNETTYAVVTYPSETQESALVFSDGNPASQPGEKVHTVYALLSK